MKQERFKMELNEIRITVMGEPKTKDRHRTFFNKHALIKALNEYYTASIQRKGIIEVLKHEVQYGRYIQQYSKTTEAEKKVKIVAKQQIPKPFTCALSLFVRFYMPIPSSYPAWKKEAAELGYVRPDKKPDTDNLVKLLKDALNGIAYGDDSQIVEEIAEKFYSDQPRTEFSLVEVTQVASAKDWAELKKSLDDTSKSIDDQLAASLNGSVKAQTTLF